MELNTYHIIREKNRICVLEYLVWGKLNFLTKRSLASKGNSFWSRSAFGKIPLSELSPCHINTQSDRRSLLP